MGVKINQQMTIEATVKKERDLFLIGDSYNDSFDRISFDDIIRDEKLNDGEYKITIVIERV